VTKCLAEQPKGRRIYFAQFLRRVLSMVACLHALGKNIMVAGTCGRVSPLMVDRKQSGRTAPMIKYNLQRHTCDLLPPMRPHLLKFPETPKIVPPVGDQVFKTGAYRRHFIFKQ
jgi:hypothetical protein